MGLYDIIYNAFCLGVGKCVGGPYDGEEHISRTGPNLYMPDRQKPLPDKLELSNEPVAECLTVHHYKWKQYYNGQVPSYGEWIYQPTQDKE